MRKMNLHICLVGVLTDFLCGVYGLESKGGSDGDENVIKRFRVDGGSPTDAEVLTGYISANIPFILTGDACVDSKGRRWKIFDEWLVTSTDGKTNQINIPYLLRIYGEDIVLVANCDKEEYGTHPRIKMKLRDYLSYLQKYESKDECLYLKDYHFVREHPNNRLYETPRYFSSDYLNEYCIDKEIDDYRFVYIGPKDSWTPFHADVLRSFSWSANICGKKRWILYPPGKEDLLKYKFGNLPYSVNVEPYTLPAHKSYQHRLEVVQNAGEIMFVPSGWHHQVHNLETTLSINHNWFNRCNLERCWSFLQDTLHSVQKEISDCREMDEWHKHCQVVLRAYLGLNYSDFFNIISHIARKRLCVTEHEKMEMHKKDEASILLVMKQMWSDSHVKLIDELKVEQCIADLECSLAAL